ncbi:peptidylprolyl isomerase [Paenibacillus nasutitermitis]|uniref:Peptidyl-prolyl cis-trans isomerase n=1 Tax=Paenibacillus nasutitermitis TaxID=1652958 RepID=A0A916YKH0_9BACL|nr:peptidylprolyl isomerase [Paenibacillus nasutitermitis]GGD48616.1 hypothetical protein GCM10010911_02670 [Paenibacillus nasutitermitis]
MNRTGFTPDLHPAQSGPKLQWTKSSMKLLLAISLTALVLLLSACGAKENTPNAANGSNSANTPGNTSGNASGNTNSTPPAESGDANTNSGSTNGSLPSGDNPVVTIEMEDGGTIEIELYPKTAPNTVNNFISLAKKGFYDGLTFHRVMPGFMIQGGDPDGRGSGGPGYSIKGEFTKNGVENNLLHERGVISMARARDMDSAGSQFFIMVDSNTGLDGLYASFGKVTKGLETVDAIVSVDTAGTELAVNPPKMKKVTVDTKGVEYPEPEKTTS